MSVICPLEKSQEAKFFKIGVSHLSHAAGEFPLPVPVDLSVLQRALLRPRAVHLREATRARALVHAVHRLVRDQVPCQIVKIKKTKKNKKNDTKRRRSRKVEANSRDTVPASMPPNHLLTT